MEKKYILIDHKKKNTLLCVHGYNSSKDFVGQLPQSTDKFNVLSFSLPGSSDNLVSESVNLDMLSKAVIKEIKKLKHTNVYILAHSMGGAIVNNMLKSLTRKDFKKIKGFIFLAPVHPLLPRSTISRILNFYLQPEGNMAKMAAKSLKIGVKIAEKALKKDLSHFIDLENPWIPILQKINRQDNYDELNEAYQSIKNDSTFIVGDKDRTIDSKLFVKYVEETLGEKAHLVQAQHSPLLENLESTKKILENVIPNEKRFFLWKKIYRN